MKSLREVHPYQRECSPDVEPRSITDQPERENSPEVEPRSITDQPEKEKLPEQSPDEPVDNIEITHQNETEINEEGDNRDEGETQTTVRRSLRQREPPKRLTYPQCGNP